MYDSKSGATRQSDSFNVLSESIGFFSPGSGSTLSFGPTGTARARSFWSTTSFCDQFCGVIPTCEVV